MIGRTWKGADANESRENTTGNSAAVCVYQSGGKASDVLVHSALGEDCSVIDFGDFVCVLSTDPITGAVEDIGRLAVNISCNDIAANGAEPIGILVTILAPEHTTPADLGRIMGQVNSEAAKLGIEVLGGHSEVTSGIDRVIISTTAVGKARKDAYIITGGAKPGDDLLLTKSVGLEGTAILATEFAAALQGKIPPAMLAQAKGFYGTGQRSSGGKDRGVAWRYGHARRDRGWCARCGGGSRGRLSRRGRALGGKNSSVAGDGRHLYCV